MEKGIQISLFDYFLEAESFTLKEAEHAVIDVMSKDVKLPSIRARIYEGIDKGIFLRVSKGVYSVTKDNSTCLLIEGNGRDLSFIKDNTIDFIITDHPYDSKSNKGGNRNFADYECFRYSTQDFLEKKRVLKPGCFLVEFLPDKNAENRRYLNDIEEMAIEAGFLYYASVPWKKGTEKHNTGRKVKDRESVVFFSKGKARLLRRDAKKELANPDKKYFMSGASQMLPSVFDYQLPSKSKRIHQAEKPLALIEEIIELISIEDELGLDQFAGSGVSGEAALNKKRDMILIEQDHNTVEKIKKRLNRKGRKQDEKVR